ncbi:hypothetical protein [Bdellovibrio bacteriovorus]|uniref:hypothetical protein n=1 Tax=Bdellovibrio bacteriovorus TaxID=959 RepID=UPI0035A68302
MKKIIATYLFGVLGLGFGTAEVSIARLETAIRNSSDYKKIEASYRKRGGSLVCHSFTEFGSVDLKPALSDYTMHAKSITADCKADPHDGLDPISERLLAIVTVTTERSLPESIDVQSVTFVTPPQPD